MELIFVYNADSGLINSLIDLAKKTIFPDSYSCNLCKITFTATMKSDWRSFISNLDYEVTFLHKDEFSRRYPAFNNQKFPAVFIKRKGQIERLITSEEINKQESVEDLKKLVSAKLEKNNNVS